MNNTIKQALHYLIHNAGNGVMTKLYLLKTIYLADRYHLRKYGRTITGNNYMAMPFGPVEPEVRSAIEADAAGDADYTDAFRAVDPSNKKTAFVSVAEPGRDSLSDTELEALDAALATFKHVGGSNIVTFTHQFPEWKNCESLLLGNGTVQMNLEDFFEPAPEGVEYCPASPELVALNREFYRDGE